MKLKISGIPLAPYCMKHLYNALFLIIFVSPFLHAQQKTDSIVSKKIKTLDSLARINPTESLEALNIFYDENKNAISKAPISLEQVYYAFSKYHYYLYEYDESIAYSKKGKKVIQENELDTPTYYYDNLLGAVFGNLEVKDSAAYYFTKSAEALANEGQYTHAAQINYNIASLYNKDFNLKDGFIYFRKSLDFYDKVEDSMKAPDYSFMVGNIGYVYEKGDSLIIAEKLGREAIKYGTKFNERNGLIFGNLTLSDVYQDQQKLDSAYAYSKEAYTISRKNEFKDFYPTTAMHLAILEAKNNPEKALEYMEEIPLDTDDRELNWLGNIDKFMGELYTRTNNFKKANFHLNKFIQFQDSLNKAETEIKAADILEKYKAAQKDLTIVQKEAEISKKENQNKIIGIITAALALLLIAFLFIYRQRQKTQQQQIIALENEKDNIALRSLMAGEEKERSRIAKELHDGLGGILAVGKMHASNIKKTDSNASDIEKISELLDTASKESRRISHNLLPENLVQKGLDAATQNLDAIFKNARNLVSKMDRELGDMQLIEQKLAKLQLGHGAAAFLEGADRYPEVSVNTAEQKVLRHQGDGRQRKR